MIKSQYFTFNHVNFDYWTTNWRCLLDVESRNLEFKEEVWAYGMVLNEKRLLFISHCLDCCLLFQLIDPI